MNYLYKAYFALSVLGVFASLALVWVSSSFADQVLGGLGFNGFLLAALYLNERDKA